MDNRNVDASIFDIKGYRYNVGIVIINDDNKVLFAKRRGHEAWQFPQGGLDAGEAYSDAMYRELREETGLLANDVEVIGATQAWHYYRLPTEYRRWKVPGKIQCIGQKQKWFLVKLHADSETNINFQSTDKPEFDDYQWVDYWYAAKKVVYFKRSVYWAMLDELSQLYDGKLPSKPLHKVYNRRRRNYYKTD